MTFRYPRFVAVLMVLSGLVLILSVLAFVSELDSGWISIPVVIVSLPILSMSYTYFDQAKGPTQREIGTTPADI